MEKIKQSFIEVIAGVPRKEHYINVTITTISIAVVVGVVMMLFWNGQY
jgi:cell division protein FtsX